MLISKSLQCTKSVKSRSKKSFRVTFLPRFVHPSRKFHFVHLSSIFSVGKAQLFKKCGKFWWKGQKLNPMKETHAFLLVQRNWENSKVRRIISRKIKFAVISRKIIYTHFLPRRVHQNRIFHPVHVLDISLVPSSGIMEDFVRRVKK